jgi:hypothetical protein
MTTPANNNAQTRSVLRTIILIASVVMFVLAAFAAGGHPLAGVPMWPWGFGAFAAWVLAGVI